MNSLRIGLKRFWTCLGRGVEETRSLLAIKPCFRGSKEVFAGSKMTSGGRHG
jgi:hypothetical protein